MDVFDKVVASIAILAGVFKTITSGCKDISDICQQRKSDSPREKETVANNQEREGKTSLL